VKIVLTILCSLLLVWAQVAAASVPATGPAATDCGCGGRMACCKPAPAPASQPLAAVASPGSQLQILSPVPATVVWGLAAAGTPFLSHVVSPALMADAAPLYARLCVRLI